MPKKNFKLVNGDSFGNPRYVIHFLNFLSLADKQGTYNDACRLAYSINGKKYNTIQFRGGIIFTTNNINEVIEDIKNL